MTHVRIGLKSVWEIWIVTNIFGWTAYEHQKRKPVCTIDEQMAISSGIAKGIVCGLFPPAFILTVNDELSDRSKRD